MSGRSLYVAAFALFVSACGSDKLVESPCREDSQCPEGQLCDAFVCVPAESKSCEIVIEGNPILQPQPYAVSFGALETSTATQTLTLHNLGNCTLTLFEAALEAGPESAFSCDVCSGDFPIELFPGRKRDVQLTFSAKGVGTFGDQLTILSDDREFPELRIPLHATYEGTPELRVAPNPIAFDYVAQGRVAKKRVQLTNQGTGTAELSVLSVAWVPDTTQDFSLNEAVELPRTLSPASADPASILAFDVQYHPRSTGAHAAELVVTTDVGELRIPVSGNSETPPKLSVYPETIDLGQVPLGATNLQTLTLVNEGGVPLHVQYLWGGPMPSTDLFATPQLIPNVAPGAYVTVQVAVTATAIGAINGLLVLSSNDPSRPSVTIPVAATGVAGPGPEVVKVEMIYDNGSDTAFDEDLRNVDLTLEHPYGYICNKQTPSPTNWGDYGTPSWIAFGPKEEPERIILPGATQDGTWRVTLQYLEDCSALPTELLAGILGISVDVLIAYLTGGVGGLDGSEVGGLIENVCLSRSPSNATVRVFVNGALIQEKTVALTKKGEMSHVLDLVRSSGKFSTK